MRNIYDIHIQVHMMQGMRTIGKLSASKKGVSIFNINYNKHTLIFFDIQKTIQDFIEP